MLEIRTDISSLTKDQREQLAGFILTFDMPRQAELPFEATDGTKFVSVQNPTEPIVHADGPLANSEKVVVTEEWIFPPTSPEAVFTGQYDNVTANQIIEVKSNHAGTITVPIAPPPPPAIISPAGPHLVIGSVAVDKSGLPWDERIHSSSKALTAEGLWRKKRGVGDTTAVESALRQLPVAAAPPPPPAESQHLIVPPTPPVITNEGKALYIKLIGDTTAAVGAKKATQEDFKSIALAHGVPSIPLLIQHLDKIQAVADDCYALIASRG